MAVHIGGGCTYANRSGLRAKLRQPGDGAHGNGSAKNLQVMMIDLVVESGFANLIESLELVKIQRISIRHNQAMK